MSAARRGEQDRRRGGFLCLKICAGRANFSERGPVSRSAPANKTGLGLPKTLLAAEHGAGHRPALLSVPAAQGYDRRALPTDCWPPQQVKQFLGLGSHFEKLPRR